MRNALCLCGHWPSLHKGVVLLCALDVADDNQVYVTPGILDTIVATLLSNMFGCCTKILNAPPRLPAIGYLPPQTLGSWLGMSLKVRAFGAVFTDSFIPTLQPLYVGGVMVSRVWNTAVQQDNRKNRTY